MKRSKKFLVTCHCVLNANAKVYPLAAAGGVFSEAVAGHIEAGCGLLQLPCPEVTYMGMNRWGMTKEQYDHPNFRTHCRDILRYPLMQVQAFAQSGCELVGVCGMDGSPNCGVALTCKGYSGGELCTPGHVAGQLAALRLVPGQGVFKEELLKLLGKEGLEPTLFAISEGQPDSQKGEKTT